MKIVVIEAIGLHLGYLGCYGNDRVATPNLDRLAAEGVVFDWHITDQPELVAIKPWRERSVGTGHYALPGHSAPFPALPMIPRVVRCDSLTSFAAESQSAMRTDDRWLWIEGPSMLPPWRLDDELLDSYFDEDDLDEGLTPWIDPMLDLVNLNDAEVLQLQNTYAAAVTVFDAQVGMLLDRTSLADTLFCVTARSGLPLGEHGMIGAPRPRLHDELVHVPMVMRLPNAAEAGMRIGSLTQPVDLLPTFLETLGSAAPACHGRSLWPLIHGNVESVRPYATSWLRVNDIEGWLMRTPDRALHVPVGPPEGMNPRMPQLYTKPEDRWEVNDLIQQQIESAEVLDKTLREFAAAIQQPGALKYPEIISKG